MEIVRDARASMDSGECSGNARGGGHESEAQRRRVWGNVRILILGRMSSIPTENDCSCSEMLAEVFIEKVELIEDTGEDSGKDWSASSDARGGKTPRELLAKSCIRRCARRQGVGVALPQEWC